MNPAEQQLREIEKPEQCDFPSSLHCPSCSGNLYFIANLSLDKETGHMTIRYIYFCPQCGKYWRVPGDKGEEI